MSLFVRFIRSPVNNHLARPTCQQLLTIIEGCHAPCMRGLSVSKVLNRFCTQVSDLELEWRQQGICMTKKGEVAEWCHHSTRMREELVMSSKAAPWTSRENKFDHKLHGLSICPRVRDCLNIMWAFRRHQIGYDVLPAEVRKEMWCNPSQGVQRKPISHGPPCFLQNTTPYSYEYDVCLSGFDMLRCMGFPGHPGVAPEHIFKDADLRSLAGEAFFLPCMTVLACAYYCNPSAPWWK